MKRVLIFGGKTGWIGQMMGELVAKEGVFCLVVVVLAYSNNDHGSKFVLTRLPLTRRSISMRKDDNVALCDLYGTLPESDLGS